jgi:zinc transporter ZupT
VPTSEISAFAWGVVSAVSLPLGAWAGLRWSPHSKVVSTLMAFGAGALLFALTIELMGELPELVDAVGFRALLAGVGGALVGGLLFDVLNQLLNNRGAFLRNLSNAKEYVSRAKRRRARRVLARLSRLHAFAYVPPEELADLVRRVRRRAVPKGESVFSPGDTADEIYFVRRGQVRITDAGEDESEGAAIVEPFDSFGELAVMTRRTRRTEAVAVTDAVLYVLDGDDLRNAAVSSTHVRDALLELAGQSANDWRYADADVRAHWLQKEADDDLGEMHMPIGQADFDDERAHTKAAAGVGMAIWLGIGIDAVPESLVIGTLATSAEGVSVAFIVGVFLANFPEAMSSAVSLRIAGFRRRRILLMWASLCLLTGVGAGIGALLLDIAPGHGPSMLVLFIAGVAAGAMLTAIVETMLPEAFEQGGSIVGMATLAGFLTALSVAALS